MKPNKLMVGQRWLLTNWCGLSKALLAEIIETDSSFDEPSAHMKVIQVYDKRCDWGVDDILVPEFPLNRDYWEYLEGQDAP